MVTLEKFKEALGSLGEQMSDEEIVRLMELQANLARALFDMWAKNLGKGIPSPYDTTDLKLVE